MTFMIPDNPKLRPFLSASADPAAAGVVVVWDQLGVSDGPRRFSRHELAVLQLLDGELTLEQIRVEAGRLNGGNTISLDFLHALVHRLDDALFLDGPRFRARVDHPVREPRCIGCYPGDPDELRENLRGLFTGPRGPGLPRKTAPDGALRAALIPHIDYPRGGTTYAWGFKEVVERTDASLFVIIGTSHYSTHRFTLTRKAFKTPLGVTPTDQDYIDRLVSHYGDGLFDDEWMAHLPEHSIELEVVFLQYLYEKRRPIRIVPLVVGSFFDCIKHERSPAQTEDIGRMIQALRATEAETGEPICYIISGDLAHIGPKFGDDEPVGKLVLAYSRGQDVAILRAAESANPERFFDVIAREGDARRICGLPPTFTTLAAARPGSGKVLHYDQYVHSKGHESVSFASVAFYQNE
jgi:AmmeMemoRadiSam system protein B